MYVPIGGRGRGIGGGEKEEKNEEEEEEGGTRCLFVTAKRDFCGNGEKNCNRDLWSVSIDAYLVIFFISNGTRVHGIYCNV